MTPIPLRPAAQLETDRPRGTPNRWRSLTRWLEFTPWSYWVESYRQARIAERKSR